MENDEGEGVTMVINEGKCEENEAWIVEKIWNETESWRGVGRIEEFWSGS
jgi:hypothetical protein